jgi:hypothetical protein
VDSVSVETGVGPGCRKRYGFNEAQEVADWTAFESLDLDVNEFSNARRAVNVLVFRIAAGAEPSVLRAIRGIKALGFTVLADRLASRISKVTIVAEGDALAVMTAYSEESVNAFRAIPGRRWVKNPNGRGGKTVFPLASKRVLFNTLTQLFPGGYGVGPKGLFQFAA